jgi:hypothetical protein
MKHAVCLVLLVGAGVAAAVGPALAQVPLPGVEETVEEVEGTVDEVAGTVDEVAGTVEATAEQTTGAVQGPADSGGSITNGGSSSGDTTSSGTISGGTISGGTSTGGTSSAGSTSTGGTSTGGTSTGGTSSGSSGTTSDGSSTSGGGRTSSGAGDGSSAKPRSGDGGKADSRSPRYRSKFDRLPRRFETLLERIELGRHVRANLRRLEHELASASPALRIRILRLVRAEIRRLRAKGTTAAERSRIERLRRVTKFLRSEATQGTKSTTVTSPSSTAKTSPSTGSPLYTSAAGQEIDGSRARPEQPSRSGSGEVLGTATRDGGQDGLESIGPQLPLIPTDPNEFPLSIGLVLLALLGLGFVGVVAGVTSHVLGRIRSS